MNEQLYPFSSGFLPINRDLKSATRLSVMVTILMTAASLGGILFPHSLYPTDGLRLSFLANDVVNLLVGLPILLACLWLARRGNLAGLLCWPGALLYSFYNYITYLIGMPLGWLSLVFAALVLLTAYPIFDILKSMDWNILKKRLAGLVVERFSGGVLAFFGIAFFFLAIGVIAEARATQTTLPMTTLGLAVADMILSVILFLGGILLFQRKPFGYASGLGLLFAASMLFIGVILIVLLQPVLLDVPFVMEDMIVLAAMGLICFIPTWLFIRGVILRSK